MTASNPQPGWYPDPGGSGGVRYWDGRAWTPRIEPPPASGTPRRPTPRALVAALTVVGVLLTLVVWQVADAVRGDRVRPPGSRPAPVTVAPAPSSPASPAEPPPTPTPGPATGGPRTPTPAPQPSLHLDAGCVPQPEGRLTTGTTTVTLPSGWGADDSPLSLDCAVTAVAFTADGWADVHLASVDPDWNLDDESILEWAWQDLGITRPYTEQRASRLVGGRTALVVTRTTTESDAGVAYDTVVRIAVVDAGAGRREVVVTDRSIRQGRTDRALTADVEALWASIRVAG